MTTSSITRSVAVLEDALARASGPLSRKLMLAVELMIAKLPQDQHPDARQKLPFLVQFVPFISKYRKDIPLITRANPTIDHGGLTEYEKHDIYKHFPEQYQLVHVDILEEEFPGKDHLDKIHTDANIGFPCMIKANKGERGVGIYYVSSVQARDRLLDQFATNTIQRQPNTLQSYCDRPEEWCLQFYQYPDHSITIGSLVKRCIPSIIGDGVHTGEELIAALGLSPVHQKNIVTTLRQEEPEMLTQVHPSGEHKQIVRKASIDFGTTYIDVTKTLSESDHNRLRTFVGECVRDLPFLSVGRFDLKAKSLEGLIQGEVRIIECNAGGGIPTHVYDAALPIAEKYAILDDHFSRIKEIALLHKTSGRFRRSYLGGAIRLFSAVRASFRKKGLALKNFTIRRQIFSTYRTLRATIQRAKH